MMLPRAEACFRGDLTMSRVVPGPLPQPQSTMLATPWLLLSLAVPLLGLYVSISCPRGKRCQLALLSNNDVLLRCNSSGARWYYFLREDSIWSSHPLSVLNTEIMPEGSILITSPSPLQTGSYSCWDKKDGLVAQYEIDFQDATALHVTHRGLGQKPLPNQTLNLGGKELIFTQWERWQDCNRCGEPGERKRVGYCYIQEPPEKPVPCWLYLGDDKLWPSRMRPELQIEACSVQCKTSNRVNVAFDDFELSESGSAWLTCPLGSVYRPVVWTANGTPLTWQGQLCGRDVSTVLDPSSGGRRLQVSQPAIYRCFVQQDLVARFNPRPALDSLGVLLREEARQRQQRATEVRKGKAGPTSVLKGLTLLLLLLLLLLGAVLGLRGVLLKFSGPAQRKRRSRVLPVK